MRKIKVVVLLVRQVQHGFTKNAKVSPNLTTVAHYGRTNSTRTPAVDFIGSTQKTRINAIFLTESY